MTPPCTQFHAYEAMQSARRAFITAWCAWLRTTPSVRLVTLELMGTQSAIRQAHDLVTGRMTIGDVAENANAGYVP